MLALRVVDQLDVLELVLPGGIAVLISATPDAFALQQLEEALGTGVVMAIASSTHAGFQVMLARKRLPFPAGELGTLV